MCAMTAWLNDPQLYVSGQFCSVFRAPGKTTQDVRIVGIKRSLVVFAVLGVLLRAEGCFNAC